MNKKKVFDFENIFHYPIEIYDLQIHTAIGMFEVGQESASQEGKRKK